MEVPVAEKKTEVPPAEKKPGVASAIAIKKRKFLDEERKQEIPSSPSSSRAIPFRNTSRACVSVMTLSFKFSEFYPMTSP